MGEIRARTPLFLLKAVAKEIEVITKDLLLQKSNGDERVPLSIYEQSLPLPQKSTHREDTAMKTIDYQDEEEENNIFQCPWCVVKLDSGAIPGINEMQQVSIALCFGIYNNSTENRGHEEIMNLIQRVYERFSINPILDGQYTCDGKFEWALQDEDTYPYFFGAIETSFKFQGYRRENKFV